MPCRFASSGTVATSRSASRAILALNVASNFLRDLVISVLHRLRQSRTLHTLTFGPISGVHFSQCWNPLCGLRKESSGSWLGRQRNLVVLQQLRIQGLINSRRQISRGRPSWRVPNVGDYRGHLAPEFSPDTEMLLGKRYQRASVKKAL